MGKQKTVAEKQYEEAVVSKMYSRLSQIIERRGIRWGDLAKLIDLDPRTLSSMKAQNVNPGYATMVKISKALDVSLDELVPSTKKVDSLYELCWTIPRLFKDVELQDMFCKQLIIMAHLTVNKNAQEIRHMDDVLKDEIHAKLEELTKETDSE